MEPPPSSVNSADDPAAKKSPFDNLSNEELIKKCKGLLAIAQKAKQAKADVSTECDNLKEKIKNLEKQKEADKESLRMMQEFIDTLTEQKLNFATEIDSYKTQNNKLKLSVESKSEDIKTIIAENENNQLLLKKELDQLKNQLATLDTETTSLKRQNKRLQDENESLINQLDDLEKRANTDDLRNNNEGSTDNSDLSKMSETLSKDLERLTLEKQSLQTDYSVLIESMKEKENYVSKLEVELNDVKKSLAEMQNCVSDNNQKLNDSLKQCELEKAKKEKLNLRLKSYKDKLEKCKTSIAQLKNSKSVLLKTVKDYSESIPKWQRDIVNASKLLSQNLLQIESENADLKEQLRLLRENKNTADDCEYDNLKIKLDSTLKELDEAKQENVSIKSEKETLVNNLKSVESEKLALANEKVVGRELIQKMEAEKSEMEETLKELNDNVAFYKAEVLRLKESIEQMKNDKLSLLKEMKMVNDSRVSSDQPMVVSLKEELASLKCALVSIEEENKLLCESNEMLKNQLDPSGDDQSTPEMRKLTEQIDSLQTDISKLETKIKSYKTENASLMSELKEARQGLMESNAVVQDYDNMKAKVANFKSENAELLKEMKEINQVMKERGETISKQDMEISEMNRKVQQLEEELREVREVGNVKDTESKELASKYNNLIDIEEKYQNLMMEKDNTDALLKERDNIIVALQEDLEKLKQNQGNVSFDARSDNISISTISRVEESSQMKDLDESFEERYSKLRMLALKLKKRIGELSLQNKTLEETNAKLESEKAELSGRMQNLSGTAKNIQSIQAEYDRLSDELERKSKEQKNSNTVQNELKNELDTTKSEINNLTIKISQLTNDLDTANDEKASLNVVIEELQTRLNSFNNESDCIKAKDAEISKIKDTLALKESQLALAESQHQQTKENLEKARKEVKKKSVLSLEMEDYEKSMKELTTKMEEDKKKIVQMESTIDTQQATINSLKSQIKLLEDQINTEEKISKETKDLLNRATENIREKEDLISSKNDMILKLERDLEDNKLSTDDLNLQLATALGDKEKAGITHGQEKSELINKLKRTEIKCNDLEEMLGLKNTELEDVKTEFNGYKLRAQSVLRQNNKKDPNLEENLKEEMAALRAEIDSLRGECDNLKSEVENVQLERSRLATRCNEQQLAISAAQTERESIAVQYSAMLKKEAQEQQNIKLQMSTLTQCYKKQLTELEESTGEKILKLQKELEFSRASLARAGIAAAPINSDTVKPQLKFVTIDSIQSSNDSPNYEINDASGEINVALLEREEGEGSESTPSPSPTRITNIRRSRGRREPMPLDQLLETVIPEDDPGMYSEGDIEQQLASAMKQIEIRDKRMAHLTELVAEAEKEVARRSQLVETLKEEIRRSQRALDRALHHHNQEYLKNVIIKFLTLNAGDERSRLVPVLNTILTLSPEETHQLNAAAKGLDPNSNKSWGSYLPWSGNR